MRKDGWTVEVKRFDPEKLVAQLVPDQAQRDGIRIMTRVVDPNVARAGTDTTDPEVLIVRSTDIEVRALLKHHADYHEVESTAMVVSNEEEKEEEDAPLVFRGGETAPEPSERVVRAG